MRIFSLLLAAVLAVSPSLNSAPSEPIPFSVSYEALQASAVTIVTERGSGSGVIVISTNGSVFVWGAAHVVKDVKSEVALVKQIVVAGRQVGFFTVMAEVIASNPTQDLAVLKPRSTHLFKTGTKFEASDYVPKLGEPVVHVGSLHGIPGAESVTTGIINFAGRVIDGLIFDQSSVVACPGSSGGGVWNSDGKCIGIIVSGYSDVFSFLVPVRRMHEWAVEMKHPEWLPN